MATKFFTPIFALKSQQMKINRSLVISLLLTVLLSAVYRIMPNRPLGFAPQIAIALFGGSLFVHNKKWAFALPLISMFLSDLLYQALYLNGLSDIQGFYGGQWINYLMIAGMAFFGFFIQNKKISRVLVAAAAAPTTYFLLSNSLVWLGGGGLHRPKNMAGYLQCLADGLPFYPNSIMSTIIFAALLFGSYHIIQQSATNKQTIR